MQKDIKKTVRSMELQSLSKGLTNRQKEVIKLLQKNEVIITDNKRRVYVTCGKETKKVTPHLFYNLVNKGLVYHRSEWPFNYVLSNTGKIVKV